MSIQMIVFDIAGTTVEDNGYVATAFKNAFEKNGYNISLADTHSYMGVKKILAVKLMLEKLGVPFTDIDAEKIHEDFVAEMVHFYETDETVKPFIDTEIVFSELKQRGIRIALNTGFPKIIADTIVNRFQWKEKMLVDDYIASDEVEEGRPSPQMINELMRRADIDDTKLVAKVGDTTIDIEEGKNVGCGYIISVTTGSGTQEELLPLQPTHIISSLSELTKII